MMPWSPRLSQGYFLLTMKTGPGLSKIRRVEATSTRPPFAGARIWHAKRSTSKDVGHFNVLEYLFAGESALPPSALTGSSVSVAQSRRGHSWQFLRVDARGRCRRDVGTRAGTCPAAEVDVP
ncbi:unnamed protein product [Symbiodinium natans]|uniref:Uncharacterized protein n=1 Tax=Symbiodinium natans TaxID=878477 RepID=A0A812QVP8_9DINO|nr:unnamed protein product [Symbiodinium natans]